MNTPTFTKEFSLKAALKAELAGGVLTDMTSRHAEKILSELDEKTQSELHKLFSAVHLHALAAEELKQAITDLTADL